MAPTKPKRVLSVKAARAEAHGLIAWAIGQAEHKGADAIREDLRKRLGDGAIPEQRSAGDDGQESVSSWAPIDLTSYIDGTHVPPAATVLVRTDGAGLLYLGRVHWFHGESESGKSWVAQVAAVEVLGDGGRVLYVDFESSPDEVVARLLLLGADPAAVTERFSYIQPVISSDRDPQAFSELLKGTYTLAVVDGVTESLGLYGAKSNDGDEVTTWGRKLPRRIARETGAATVCIDHVTKDPESRGRFAIGSQAKMALLDGCAFMVEPKDVARGQVGYFILRVGKDRAGAVRMNSGTYRATDRSQESARIRFDSTDPKRIKYTVEPHAAYVNPETGESTFRPTYLMERASRYIEVNPDKSTREITTDVSGSKQALGTAIEVLAKENYVEATEYVVRGGAGKRYRSLRPYRESEDPQSDKFQGSSEGGDPVPPPRGGEPGEPGRLEPPSDPVPGPGRNRVEPGSDQGKQVGTGSADKRSSQDQEPGRNQVDVARSNEDRQNGRVVGVSETNWKIHNGRGASTTAVADPKPSGPRCARCQQPSTPPLILGRCRRCAYPTEPPEDDLELPERPTFATWLAEYRDADDARGHLARTVAADDGFPAALNTWTEVEAHLTATITDPAVLGAAYDAWGDYRLELP